MDEKLLAGRLSVNLDPPLRCCGTRNRSSSATTLLPDAVNGDSSPRPRTVSRTSSRADKCLKRSKTTFDLELFRSRLRLNKTLSRIRFKPERIHLTDVPTSLRQLEFSTGDNSSAGKQEPSALSDTWTIQSAEHTTCKRQVDETASMVTRGVSNHTPNAEQQTGTSQEVSASLQVTLTSSSGLSTLSTSLKDEKHSRATLEKLAASDASRISFVQGGTDILSGHLPAPAPSSARKGTQWNAIAKATRIKGLQGTVVAHLKEPGDYNAGSGYKGHALGKDSGDGDDDADDTDDQSRRDTACGGERVHLQTRDSGHASSTPRDRRLDESFVFHDSSDDSQYDTDCDVDENSEFMSSQRRETASRQNADIGHLTYETVCAKLGVMPLRSVIRQLPSCRLQLNHSGINNTEAKALAVTLLHNTRLDDLDLSNNGLTGAGIAHITDSCQRNIYITKLNLSGNIIDDRAAQALSEMLSSNKWLTHLNLADCRIGNAEICLLSKGIQVNPSVVCLNLSKNEIGIAGCRDLGTAIGLNKGLECLNLSWNMIRRGGAVAICNSLQRNSNLRELNLSWNGLGFEGSLALCESLRINVTLKKLNVTNNRVHWDCIPYLTSALHVNKRIEVLEMGQNPVSMDGVMSILEAIDRTSSRVKFLSLLDIPINTKIAFKATEISKKREFSLEHGGIIAGGEVFGFQKLTRREDPVTLLIRYLSTMGIRVVDLFRVFDTDSKFCVSEANFVRGLKRVRAPLDEDDMVLVARRLRSDKRGAISYQELAANVRSHIREQREEDKRLQLLENKAKEKRRRILQSDMPLYGPSAFTYLPALYNMFGRNVVARSNDSRQSTNSRQEDSRISFPFKSSPRGLLPPVDTPGRGGKVVRAESEQILAGRRTPVTLIEGGEKSLRKTHDTGELRSRPQGRTEHS